jgi:methylenetetrahydrofolate reductase (NADPH)
MAPSGSFSVEIFPAHTAEGHARLAANVARLVALGPEFISVTYGAGGCTRAASLAALRLVRDAGGVAVPHVSGAGASHDDIRSLLCEYETLNATRLVVLRGDPSSGLPGRGAFPYAAELVRFIRAETGSRYHIDVAAYPETHPQARNADDDLAHFKAKLDAGANSAITQYFFNADAYEDFLERCAANGISVPVVPGVMPVAGFARLVRFSEAHGIEIPAWIRRRVAAYGDDASAIRAFGVEIVCRLCERLLALGAPGLHFFSLNDAQRVASVATGLRAPVAAGRPQRGL